MSVDITFEKQIKLKELAEQKDFNLKYYSDEKLYVIEKGEDSWLQVIVDDPCGDIEKDNEKRIAMFTSRCHGWEIVKDICLLFQTSFITDSDETELFFKYNEMCEVFYKNNIDSIGLIVDENGIIKENNA